MNKRYVNLIITILLILLIIGIAGCGILLKKRSEEKNGQSTAQTAVTETSSETAATETSSSEETSAEETTTEAETTTEKETVDVSMYDTPLERFLYSITDIDTMIVVIGDGYSKNSAVCYYYEKTDGVWNCLLAVDAWCGSNGFSDHTFEGDRTTPVGCFELGVAFGNYENPGTALEWIDVNEHLYWVDDNTSKYYEQLIDDREVPGDSWNSGEHLISYGVYYGYSIHIKVNPPYETSAIFLHNDGGITATAGCVGIPEDSMRWILQNIKTDTRIAIVEHDYDLDNMY